MDLAQDARDHGFRIVDLNTTTWAALRGPTPASITQVGNWTLLGDVFPRRRSLLSQRFGSNASASGDALFSSHWGRYAGLRFDHEDRLEALLRDPSGAVECVVWNSKGLTVICSSAETWLLDRLTPPWRIDYDRVAQALHQLIPPFGDLMLSGPVALAPGEIQPMPLGEAATTGWRPADFARFSREWEPSPTEAARCLEEAIEEAVFGLSSLGGPLACEVSGGLDSAIIAAILARDQPEAMRLWINAYGSTPESDERRYAQDLGVRLGFAVRSLPHVTEPMREVWMQAISSGFRPGFNALDFPQDVAWARAIAATGSKAVLTGKGGDSILCQAASVDVFVDRWLKHGWRALAWRGLPELAAANEVSIWEALRKAVKSGNDLTPMISRRHPILRPREIEPSLHPWLSNCESLGPSKCFQIAGVADSVSHHGPSGQTGILDIRHPLCAQPVTETCLALPTWLLALSGRDRGLARQAFRDRLPISIIERRSKGEMTRIYGRMIVDNLSFIRGWLIDGRLADLGLIDPDEADRELTPEALIWRGQYAVIMTALAIEGWVRSWEDRLAPAL